MAFSISQGKENKQNRATETLSAPKYLNFTVLSPDCRGFGCLWKTQANGGFSKHRERPLEENRNPPRLYSSTNVGHQTSNSRHRTTQSFSLAPPGIGRSGRKGLPKKISSPGQPPPAASSPLRVAEVEKHHRLTPNQEAPDFGQHNCHSKRNKTPEVFGVSKSTGP